MRKLRTIKDVVDWGLCVGCGACFSFCDQNNAVELVNIRSVGIRPIFNTAICRECSKCLAFCPGYAIDANINRSPQDGDCSKNLLLGSYHELWEGHASDPEIQFEGSSGGILTALAIYCLEIEKMAFVLHTGMDPEKPWQNKTIISRDRSEVLKNSGSRYCTSSPCELLHKIEESDRPCVFIGKPCDVAAVSMARKFRPKLDQNLGIVLSFFCAGTPCSKATVELSEKLGIKADDIKTIRYRGQGWPGAFKIVGKNGLRKEMTYRESWGFVQNQRPFRCHICPDGLGQLSDITPGDAWNQYTGKNNQPGLSHVVVRSQEGKNILHKALSDGYLKLLPIEPHEVIAAQGLTDRKKMVFGRLFGMNTLGLPTTRFRHFDLFNTWLLNNPIKILKSIIGTQKRIIKKWVYKKRNPSSYQPDDSDKQAAVARPNHLESTEDGQE